MATSAQSFPILSPEQSDAFGVAFNRMAQSLGQFGENQATRIKNKAALAALPYAGQEAQADIAYKNALANYYPILGQVSSGDLALKLRQYLMNQQGADALEKIYGGQSSSPPPGAPSPNQMQAPLPATSAEQNSPLQLNPQQQARLQQFFPNQGQANVGGAPQAATANSVIPDESSNPVAQRIAQQIQNPQHTGNGLTPLDDYNINLDRAKRAAVEYTRMGQGDLGASMVATAQKGTPLQQNAAKDDATRINSAYKAMDASSELLPTLDQMENVASKTNKELFWPGVRSVSPQLSSDIKTLQNHAGYITQILKDIRNVPASMLRSNMEMQMLRNISADPKQPYDSFRNSLQFLRDISVRNMINKDLLTSYTAKYGNSSGFQPYIGIPSQDFPNGYQSKSGQIYRTRSLLGSTTQPTNGAISQSASATPDAVLQTMTQMKQKGQNANSYFSSLDPNLQQQVLALYRSKKGGR